MTLRYLPRSVLTRRTDETDEHAHGSDAHGSNDCGSDAHGSGPQGADSPDGRWNRTVSALAEGRLELHVQPVAALGAGGYVGLETLVRLPDPAPARPQPVMGPRSLTAAGDLGGPDEVVALNAWLVREAAAALARWIPARRPQQDGIRFVAVSVDERFMADESFLGTVKDGVRQAGIGADNLLLTVDGRPGLDRLWSKLQRLKSHGVRVALDDFGPGSHATDLLRRFSFDAVRMPAPDSVALAEEGNELRTTIKLAHNLGCEVIVDGVLDDEHLEGLRWLGADLAVGPRLGHPSPASLGPRGYTDLAARPAG